MRLIQGALIGPLIIAGCDASFTDLRPDAVASIDAQGVDAGTLDTGVSDAGAGDGDADMTFMDAAEQPEMIISSGVFSGRGSYRGGGGVSLVRTTGGSLVLRFASDFETSSVPGPYVVLTTRDRIGARIDTSAGDIEIGPLTASRGAQEFTVPEAGRTARFAWIFCRPFGVEIARAALEGT